jgi:hypothetical protein
LLTLRAKGFKSRDELSVLAGQATNLDIVLKAVAVAKRAVHSRASLYRKWICRRWHRPGTNIAPQEIQVEPGQTIDLTLSAQAQ